MKDLMDATAFMPVYEKHQTGGLQLTTDDKTKPPNTKRRKGTWSFNCFYQSGNRQSLFTKPPG